MHPSRRQFLATLPTIFTLSACQRASPPRTAAYSPGPRVPRVEPKRPPHYVVLIVLAGGVDPVLTIDPKDSAKIGNKIDCEYVGDDRLRGKDRLYGPLFAPLLRHESDFTIVHGIRADTVSHSDGVRGLLFGQHNYSYRHGPLVRRFGPDWSRGATVPSLRLDLGLSDGDGPSVVLDDSTIAKMARRTPIPSRGRLGPQIEALQTSELKDRLADFPNEAEDMADLIRRGALVRDWLANVQLESVFDSRFGAALGLAADAITHDRARYVEVLERDLWFDSHSDNLALQRKRVLPAYEQIAKFFDYLKATRNEFGRLYDQTTIAIGSEFGRFPKLNAMAGKDHWPESSWLLSGKGIRKNTIVGQTDDRLFGAPFDPRTGSTSGANRRPIFVDSVAATLLRAAGIALDQAGYRDEDSLDCVLAER